MNDNENIIIDPMEEENDAILPDGWAEGDDLFSDDEWTGDDQADESAEEPAQESEVGETSEDEDPAPTTEQDTDSDDSGEAQEEAPTTEQETDTKPNSKLKFRARVDHEDHDVELDESELPTVYQKAQNHDRAQAKLAKVSPMLDKAERLSRSLGYENLEAMLASAEENYLSAEVKRLVGEGVHEEVAKDMVARKMAASAAAAPAAEKPEDKAQESAPTSDPSARDFKAEIQELYRVNPKWQGKQLPDEVAKACALGNKRLVDAVAEYEARQSKAEAVKLRKENQILKQNAASAAKAPVKGVTGGGATDTKAMDPFEEGFDSDDW